MERRDLLRRSGYLLTGYIASASIARPVTLSLTMTRSLRLFDSSNGEQLQDCVVTADGIYYLSRRAGKGRQCTIGLTLLDGSEAWRNELPLGLFVAIGVLGGTPILHLVDKADSLPGNSLVSFDRKEKALSIWASIPAGPAVRFFGGDSFGRTNGVDSIELFTVEAGGRLSTMTVQYPASESELLEKPASDCLAVIDQRTGRLTAINPQTHSVESHQIDGNEMRGAIAARDMLSTSNSLSGANSSLNPVVVSATGTNGRNSLLCLLSPLKPGRLGTILAISRAGVVTSLARCTLPRRTVGQFTIPRILAVSRGELLIIFGDGSIAAFSGGDELV